MNTVVSTADQHCKFAMNINQLLAASGEKGPLVHKAMSASVSEAWKNVPGPDGEEGGLRNAHHPWPLLWWPCWFDPISSLIMSSDLEEQVIYWAEAYSMCCLDALFLNTSTLLFPQSPDVSEMVSGLITSRKEIVSEYFASSCFLFPCWATRITDQTYALYVQSNVSHPPSHHWTFQFTLRACGLLNSFFI